MNSHLKLISAMALAALSLGLSSCKPANITIQDPLGLGGTTSNAVSAEIDLLNVQTVDTLATNPGCNQASFADVTVSAPGNLQGMVLTQPWKGQATITDANGNTPSTLPNQITLNNLSMSINMSDAVKTLPQLTLSANSSIVMTKAADGTYTFPNTQGTLGINLDAAQVNEYLSLITAGGRNTVFFCTTLGSDLTPGQGLKLKMPFASGTATVLL